MELRATTKPLALFGIGSSFCRPTTKGKVAILAANAIVPVYMSYRNPKLICSNIARNMGISFGLFLPESYKPEGEFKLLSSLVAGFALLVFIK